VSFVVLLSLTSREPLSDYALLAIARWMWCGCLLPLEMVGEQGFLLPLFPNSLSYLLLGGGRCELRFAEPQAGITFNPYTLAKDVYEVSFLRLGFFLHMQHFD